MAVIGRIDDALVLAIALCGNMGGGPLSRGEFYKRTGVITAIDDDMA